MIVHDRPDSPRQDIADLRVLDQTQNAFGVGGCKL